MRLQAACVLVTCNETAFLWWYKLCDFTLFHSWVLNNQNQCRCFSFFLSDIFKAALPKKKKKEKKKEFAFISILFWGLSDWVHFSPKNEHNFYFQQNHSCFTLIIERMGKHSIFFIATTHNMEGQAAVLEFNSW